MTANAYHKASGVETYMAITRALRWAWIDYDRNNDKRWRAEHRGDLSEVERLGSINAILAKEMEVLRRSRRRLTENLGDDFRRGLMAEDGRSVRTGRLTKACEPSTT